MLKQIGAIAHKIMLPSELLGVHNIFHVSILCKYHPDPTHILQYESLPLEKKLTYEERPIYIPHRREKTLRNKVIPLVKVL